MRISKLGLLAGCAWLLAPAAALAEEADKQQDQDDPGVWRVSTGVTYSEGDYGDVEDTKVVSAPVAIKYKRGSFSVRVSVPYVHVKGPGSLLDTPQGSDAGFGDDGSGGDDSSGSGGSGSDNSGSGGGGGDDFESGSGDDVIPIPPVPGVTDSRGGIGDVSVTLGYSLELGRTTWFDLSSRVKLPTASTAKRLGTGKVDVTLGGNLVQDIGDLSLSAGARYRFLGKPAGSTLRDTWGAGAGLSYRLPGGAIIGADYDWRESTRPGRGSSSDATGWVNFGLTKNVRLQVYGSTGLNDRSADLAGGLSLSVRLN
jgi:hypothetical protein